MPRNMPASIIKKLYSKNIDSAFLTVLTIYANGSILRLVNNQEDVEYKGNSFSASHFTIVHPDDQPDTVPSASIVFADTANTFLDLVRNYSEIECDIEVIAAKTTGSISIETNGTNEYYAHTTTTEVYETYVGPYEMRLESGSADSGTTSFTISYDDIGQYNFPRMTFNPYDFPSIY